MIECEICQSVSHGCHMEEKMSPLATALLSLSLIALSANMCKLAKQSQLTSDHGALYALSS